MTAPIGVALVGCGGIGALRARAIDRAPEFSLQVVADVRDEAAAALARRHRCRTAPPAAAVADPAVGLVIVATPPNRHLSGALAAIAAGKHVLCEKPLAVSVAEGAEMCAAAEERGVLLKTGFNHRYFPALAGLRRKIEAGELGTVVRVRAAGGHQGGEEFGHDWVRDPAVTGGGTLVDNGIHLLDLVRFALGEVHYARGYTGSLVWPFPEAEDTALALFRSESGALASLDSSWTEWRGYHFAVEAIGDRGFARAAYPPMRLEWGRIAAPGQRARRRLDLFPLHQVRERLGTWRWAVVRSFVDELAALAAGIRSGAEVPATGRDGLRALQMAEAVYRSAREGVEVRF